jgi:hypothetical protein
MNSQANIGESHNHRIQATAGGAAVLNDRVRRSPAAPDAERWADEPRVGKAL